MSVACPDTLEDDRWPEFARASQRRLLISTVVLVVAITLIALYLAHTFVRPIDTLIAGARQVGEGHTDVVVSLKARDELGDQNLQAHQNSTAEDCTTAPVGCFARGPLKEIANGAKQGKCESEDQDSDRDPLERP